MTRKRITVKDVAEKAGVSPSTVSRVISDNPRISQKTKDRVLACMDELGYVPNAHARSLVSNKTGTVGIIIPTKSEDYFLNPFFLEALTGIARSASKKDYDILLSTYSEQDEELLNIKKLIKASKIDGILLISSKVEDESIKYLESIDFPFAIIGSTNLGENVNQVDNDNFKAAYELTEHIIKIGKDKIALIAGDEELVVTKERLEGYKKALIDNNLEIREDYIFHGSFDEHIGYESARKIVDLEDRPNGLVVTDDLMAHGAARYFSEKGLKVPEDIAIGSFNNSALVKYSYVPLTSVDINPKSLGEKSMDLLIDAIEKETRGEKILVSHEIYRRKSTKINARD